MNDWFEHVIFISKFISVYKNENIYFHVYMCRYIHIIYEISYVGIYLHVYAYIYIYIVSTYITIARTESHEKSPDKILRLDLPSSFLSPTMEIVPP